MTDQSLTNYIKQNLANGFSETEIRGTLQNAGWYEAEIEEGFLEAKQGARPKPPESPAPEPEMQNPGFLARYGKPLLISLIILIAAPALVYGGIFAYQRFFSAEDSVPGQTNPPADQTTEATAADRQAQEMAKRDEQRLDDVASLQSALGAYFAASQFYPKTLETLVSATTTAATSTALTVIPRDPKTNNAYLYTALGDPPLYYSLSFVLEEDVGTLKAGLQVVTGEKIIDPEALKKENAAVKGESAAQTISGELQITDLSKLPFYPGEEVSLEISAGIPLNTVLLVMEGLNLVDRQPPYGFNFSAPETPRDYEVKVFGFDGGGNSYFQMTKLTVAPRRP